MSVLAQLADQRHHGNTGAAAQRLLSDFTQGYLGRHTFELPPRRYAPPGTAPADANAPAELEARASREHAFFDVLQCVRERLTEQHSEAGAEAGLGESSSNSNMRLCARVQAGDGRRKERGWMWTMRRQGQRLSFLLDPSGYREVVSTRRTEEGRDANAASRSTPGGRGPPRASNPRGMRRAEKSQGPLDVKACSGLRASDAEQAPPQLFTRAWLEGW